MSNFFSNTHESVPDDSDKNDYSYCKGSIDHVSFSSMTTYENCPYQLLLKNLHKLPRKSAPAAERGSKLHDKLEQYVKGDLDSFNWKSIKSGEYHRPLIESFREDYQIGLCHPEIQYGLTKKLKSCAFDADEVWHRGILDILTFESDAKHRALIYDYKSGSSKSGAKHRSQLMLYALVSFMLYPTLKEIHTSPIYIDEKVPTFLTRFVKKDLELFWPRYSMRLNAVTDATVFPAKPSNMACRWCDFAHIDYDAGETEPFCGYAYA
jgi:hypothetical protein